MRKPFAHIPRPRRAFTLLELIVVIMIVSSLASLAMVQHQRTVDTIRSNRAKDNLIGIHGAVKAYEINNGSIPAANINTLASINTELGTFFIDDVFVYQYTTEAGTTWTVTAMRGSPATITWSVNQNSITDNPAKPNPTCSPTANCPK